MSADFVLIGLMFAPLIVVLWCLAGFLLHLLWNLWTNPDHFA